MTTESLQAPPLIWRPSRKRLNYKKVHERNSLLGYKWGGRPSRDDCQQVIPAADDTACMTFNQVSQRNWHLLLHSGGVVHMSWDVEQLAIGRAKMNEEEFIQMHEVDSESTGFLPDRLIIEMVIKHLSIQTWTTKDSETRDSFQTHKKHFPFIVASQVHDYCYSYLHFYNYTLGLNWSCTL